MPVGDHRDDQNGDDIGVGDGLDAGQRAPYDRRAAVEAILLKDDSLMGRIYRYGLEGKTPAEIAEAEDNQTVGVRLQLPNSAQRASQLGGADEPVGRPQRGCQAEAVAPVTGAER